VSRRFAGRGGPGRRSGRFGGNGTIARWSAALLLIAGTPIATAAQLRPLEPLEWAVFEPSTRMIARAGFAALLDQRASFAGTRGSLLEVGNLAAAWRSGRIAIEAGGTIRRIFEDETRYAEAHPTVRNEGPRRTDSGDFNIGTVVRLTPDDRPALLALRFGTRLPNSDDEVGLDRDRTDFYALLGGRVRHHALHVAGEAGIGIFGTHDPEFEQADPLLYSLSAGYALGALSVHSHYLGHRAGFGGWVQRGSESRSELRLGAAVGGRYRLRLEHVRGLAAHSPSRGWRLDLTGTR
jgi:hypothetical protein